MATFTETFLCTALPESVNGTIVTLAVLVSPRLASDSSTRAPLTSWPDARDWPTIQPTWQVTITQGSTTVTLPATDVAGAPYDLASWQQLFPSTMEITPYVPVDRSAAPVRSYPAATVRNAARDLHLHALTASRTDFPALDDLNGQPVFAALVEAADPDVVRSAQQLQATDPVPDALVGIATAFAFTDLFHGGRVGPTVTGVSPNTGNSNATTPVTITGTGFTGGTAVYFGSLAAVSFSVINDKTIAATAPYPPTGGGLVDVTVTGPGGTSAISPADQFTFISVH